MPVWLGILVGVVILVWTWTSVVFTLVLPRAVSGPGRLSIWITRSTRRLFFAISRFAHTYERKDAVLAPIGPVAVLAQLVVWLALIGAAFVVMLVPYTHDFGDAVSEVGAAMFTLGSGAFIEFHQRHRRDLRRRVRIRRHRVADRVPAGALRRVQPSGVAHRDAGQPRRRTVVGSRDPHPASTRRHRRHAARLLRPLGTVGGRVLRIALQLPRAPALPLTRPVVVVGDRAALRARRRRHAALVEPDQCAVPGPPGAAHGVHGTCVGSPTRSDGSTNTIRCPTIRSSSPPRTSPRR